MSTDRLGAEKVPRGCACEQDCRICRGEAGPGGRSACSCRRIQTSPCALRRLPVKFQACYNFAARQGVSGCASPSFQGFTWGSRAEFDCRGAAAGASYGGLPGHRDGCDSVGLPVAWQRRCGRRFDRGRRHDAGQRACGMARVWRWCHRSWRGTGSADRRHRAEVDAGRGRCIPGAESVALAARPGVRRRGGRGAGMVAGSCFCKWCRQPC